MNKRTFLRTSFLGGLAALAGPSVFAGSHRLFMPGADEGPFTLPALPYAFDALEPNIDAKTMEIHHDRHHQAYVTKLNAAVKGTPAANMSLEQIFAGMGKYEDPIRNNAGGHWNHSFFWKLMSPKGGGQPGGELANAIIRDFAGYDRFKEQFKKAALDRFGSGWAWLSVDKNKKLFISSCPNQDNPLMDLPGNKMGTPVLGLDVWEHAYYLKYQNKRPDYVDAFFNVVNWEQAGMNYEKAK
ncbi:MAG: superoxide dismutase [Bacteroidota bacterium]